MKRVIKKKIPVSKHVKKFLLYYFYEPYIYSKDDFLGPLFAGVFKKGYRTSVMKKGEDSFEVHLRHEDSRRIGSLLSWSNSLAFNKAVDKVFRAQLFNHMDLNRKLDKEMAKPAMVQFLVEMNITEDDIDYDTLYRDYKRKQIYPKTIRENIVNQIVKNNMADLSPDNGRFVPKTNA